MEGLRCPIMIKNAANKQADAMTKAFSKGLVSLKNIAKASKKLKLKPRTLKSLGSGAEGTAYLMNHPTEGLAVNKVFNTKGKLYHPDLIKDKIKIMKKMKGKGLPKYLGKGYGDDAIMMEHVKGTPFDLSDIKDKGRIADGLKTKAKIFMRTGKITGDYVRNPTNMIKTPSGKSKVFDFIPATKALHKTPYYKGVSSAKKDIWGGLIKSVKKRGLKPKKNYSDFLSNMLLSKNLDRLAPLSGGMGSTIKPYKGFSV